MSADRISEPAPSLGPSLKSRIARQIAARHDPLARWRSGPALELYYEAGDPHSQLCAQLARRIIHRLKIPLTIRMVPAPDAASYPEADKQRAFAWRDAALLAPLHRLQAAQELSPAQILSLQQSLAGHKTAQDFLAAEQQALQEPESMPLNAKSRRVQAELRANAARRRKLGHYLPAMWQYRGEWFWGLDRLDILLQRLLDQNAIEGAEALCPREAVSAEALGYSDEDELEFWFSFRSPYSYLAAVQLWRLHLRGDLPPLRVRPVLPMVMRGLPVPRNKRLYIVRDVKRCADAQGIPFEYIHDPVGDGVMRMLSCFPQQADPIEQLQYCALAGQSVWADGLDLCQDRNLRDLIERCGLDWKACAKRLADGYATDYAEKNRDDLFAAGLWGVPSFRRGPMVTWGQDRIDWVVPAKTAS